MKIIKKLMALVVVVFITVCGQSGFAQEVKIGVAAQAPQADAQISEVAARAPYFVIFDGQGNLLETVANPYQQAGGGAGPQVVEFLAAKGVKIVIAGEFGAKMAAAMQANGMTARRATGMSAADAVKAPYGSNE